MGGYGGFYKGEKKKPKKDTNKNARSNETPVMVMPEIISKKKKDY